MCPGEDVKQAVPVPLYQFKIIIKCVYALKIEYLAISSCQFRECKAKFPEQMFLKVHTPAAEGVKDV